MNAEVIKAMNKKESKKHFTKFRKWWKANGYIVMRVIFFPVWLWILTSGQIERWIISRNNWDEARADEIFQYLIPRKCKWYAENKEFYFFDNGMGWAQCYNKYLKRKDRTFWKIHKGWGGGKLRAYLIESFELEGFKKEFGNCYDGWTEITFKLIEE